MLVTALVAGAAWTTLAADYYVSSIHPQRDDAHPGTSPDAPWATLDKVKNEWPDLAGGDTVHLERGSQWNLSFNGDYWYVSSGGDVGGGPVTLRGDDYGTGPQPVIKRTGGSGSSAFIIVQKSHVTIRDITLDGGHADYGKNTIGISVGDDNEDISYVNVLNMTITNLGGNASSYICGIWVVSYTGYRISDCLIEGNYVADYSAHGLNHYSPGPMDRIVWRNNIVNNNFTGGRYPSANSALQVCSGSDDCTFEFNYLQDRTTTEGVILGFGKYSDDRGYNRMRYNIITHSDTFGALFTIDHTDRKLLYELYGNVFYDNDRAGLAIHPYNSYAPDTHFRIYNNTFVNNYTDGGSDTTDGQIEIDNQCDNTAITVINNVITCDGVGDEVCLAVDYGFSGTLEHAHNLYWHTGGASRNAVTYNDVYTVEEVGDFEGTAQNGDPQFGDVDAVPTAVSSRDGAQPTGLLPISTSPAVNNGMTIAGEYAQSINMMSRPDGEWTIGAFQYTVASHTPQPPTNLRIISP
jgi:hypothetical protein